MSRNTLQKTQKREGAKAIFGTSLRRLRVFVFNAARPTMYVNPAGVTDPTRSRAVSVWHSAKMIRAISSGAATAWVGVGFMEHTMNIFACREIRNFPRKPPARRLC
jgi:hypothetical protein